MTFPIDISHSVTIIKNAYCEEIMLQVGQPAPGFQLADDQNRTVDLKDFQGHPLVFFFFPKTDAPG